MKSPTSIAKVAACLSIEKEPTTACTTVVARISHQHSAPALEGKRLTCPKHQWAFDVTTGSVWRRATAVARVQDQARGGRLLAVLVRMSCAARACLIWSLCAALLCGCATVRTLTGYRPAIGAHEWHAPGRGGHRRRQADAETVSCNAARLGPCSICRSASWPTVFPDTGAQPDRSPLLHPARVHIPAGNQQ